MYETLSGLNESYGLEIRVSRFTRSLSVLHAPNTYLKASRTSALLSRQIKRPQHVLLLFSTRSLFMQRTPATS